MKIERTTKITLDNEDQRALNAVMDMVSEIFDKMDDYDTLVVYGAHYDHDCVEMIGSFLSDLWHNGDCTFEITEG